MAVDKISTFSIIGDVIIRRVDHPPVRVAFGIIVEELVSVGAVACVAFGVENRVSIGDLMGMDVGAQHKRGGRENTCVRVIDRCPRCVIRGGYHRRDTCSSRGNSQELKSASSPVRFTYKG